MFWELFAGHRRSSLRQLRGSKKNPWAEQFKNGGFSEATTGRAGRGSGSPVGSGLKRHWPRPRREGPGQLWLRQRQPLGDRHERGRVAQHLHGPHGQDLSRLGIEIGRDRNADFSDEGVRVEETGVRPTINRDHFSKEAERRAGLGSQTSTPSIAPNRPRRGRTVRTVWPSEVRGGRGQRLYQGSEDGGTD